MTPRFSLILCTVGRDAAVVAAFLDSVLAQGDHAATCQVLLVDQNRDDRLAHLSAAYAGRLDVAHVPTETRGLSRARNVGLDRASGEIVGFPDDDCEYLPGTLARVDALFADDTFDAITGHPTGTRTPSPVASAPMELDRLTVMNRCQEFTIFVRRSKLNGLRFNDLLGVGAGTPWGSDEGPDFLVRLVDAGRRLVYHPDLLVYHPDKVRRVTRDTVRRAASYARGRGAFFRLHRYPWSMVARGVFRPAGGCALYLLKLQPMRSAYYFAVATGTVRGLCLSRTDRATLAIANPPFSGSPEGARVGPSARAPSGLPLKAVAPTPLPALPARPLVSVLIANHNYARFLPAALDSLLAQTYAHWQAVVLDDGSTDDSAAVAQRYADGDARVRLVRQPNAGQTAAVNACFTHLSGDVVCLLDSDDTFAADKVERVVAAFAADAAVGVVTHHTRVVDSDGRTLVEQLTPHLDAGWLAPTAATRGACVGVPVTSALSFRRAVLDQLMPIPTTQRRDVDGYLGMAAQFLTHFATVDAPLADYRVHGRNMGGLTDPTPGRLHYELTLIAERTDTLAAFLADRFGGAYAAAVRLADNPQFVQAALKLHAIDPGHADLAGHPVAALLAAHPSAKWRTLWRAIFATPRPVRRRLVPALHRSHKLKAFVRRLVPAVAR